MTNERKLLQRIKSLEDKMDTIMVLLQIKKEGTWVSGRYLVSRFGITDNDLRTLRRAGIKTKGEGVAKRYLLDSFPDSLLKKREAADKASSQINDQ